MKRIMLWGDTLSQAGKETMIKSVGQALPTNIMVVSKLPYSVCDDLTNLVTNFWWGKKEGKNESSLAYNQNAKATSASMTSASSTKHCSQDRPGGC